MLDRVLGSIYNGCLSALNRAIETKAFSGLSGSVSFKII